MVQMAREARVAEGCQLSLSAFLRISFRRLFLDVGLPPLEEELSNIQFALKKKMPLLPSTYDGPVTTLLSPDSTYHLL
jgi:hypothetical protein